MMEWTPERLLGFEEAMAGLFEQGFIKAPLHLAGGNEQQLIDIFKNVRPQDWILTSWRAHYHALLKGVSIEALERRICEGRSIALCFKEQRMLSSAIVGGVLPIAVGLALGIKKRGADERVWAFIGDMTARSGVAHECQQYARGHNLPLTILTEDNGLSVCTPTAEAWGREDWRTESQQFLDMRYHYELTRPHVGTGTWVSF